MGLLDENEWGEFCKVTSFNASALAHGEHRIYLDALCERYAIVDASDYLWAKQWNWRAMQSRKRFKGRVKFYAFRNKMVCGKWLKIYLHKEILLRAVGPPATGATIGDHKNGDSLNDKRYNLRWATASQNRRNRV